MEKTFYTAEDIARIIGRSENYAYKLIRQLNDELASQGYIVVRARIPRKYFEARAFGGGDK